MIAPVSLDAVATEHALRRAEICLAGQKDAFEACLNGAPLAASLSILVRTAVKQSDGEARAAFYIADESGKSLQHVVGMPEAYARCVNGFIIAGDSIACGLAAYSRQTVITEDVTKDPAWGPWLWLSEQFGFRACWSFPVQSSARVEGTFAIYFGAPRRASPTDLKLAAVLASAAAIIIAQKKTAGEVSEAPVSQVG